MEKRRRMSLELPEFLDKEVMTTARKEGQTKSEFIRSCIRRGIDTIRSRDLGRKGLTKMDVETV